MGHPQYSKLQDYKKIMCDAGEPPCPCGTGEQLELLLER